MTGLQLIETVTIMLRGKRNLSRMHQQPVRIENVNYYPKVDR